MKYEWKRLDYPHIVNTKTEKIFDQKRLNNWLDKPIPLCGVPGKGMFCLVAAGCWRDSLFPQTMASPLFDYRVRNTPILELIHLSPST